MKQTIYYISLRDIRKINPSAVVMMQTCHQLAESGYRVIFLVPFFYRHREIKRADVWEAYNIPRESFKIVFLPVFFREGIGARFFKVFSHLIYAFGLLAAAIARKKASVHIISRDIISAYPYLLLLSPVRRWKKVTFLYELHVPSLKLTHRLIYKKMDRIYCITDGVRKFLLTTPGIDQDKTTTIRPGFDPSAYANNRDKISLRKKLGIPAEGFVVMYTGKVTRQMKEIRLILKAAQALPGLLFVLVGGRPVNIQPLKRFCLENGIMNVIFTGLVEPGLVPGYQLSADILLRC
jgi:glycosyltransferase involved in cell wall biosynthesis